jgi:hypothetical protein
MWKPWRARCYVICTNHQADTQGLEAWRTALERFSLERMVAGYLDVYDRLLLKQT